MITIEDMITILRAVMGAVGPEICVFVPPKRAAKKLKNKAPYRPAEAPSPEETPNANAKGRATIPAVNPPKKSPRICLNIFFILKVYVVFNINNNKIVIEKMLVKSKFYEFSSGGGKSLEFRTSIKF